MKNNKQLKYNIKPRMISFERHLKNLAATNKRVYRQGLRDGRKDFLNDFTTRYMQAGFNMKQEEEDGCTASKILRQMGREL